MIFQIHHINQNDKNMKKKYITMLYATTIVQLEPVVQEEIQILQQDENEVLSVDVRPGLHNTYIATIIYQDLTD